MAFEAVIGLEVHVQLKTRTKMFTRAPYHYGAPPNSLVDPVVLGLPGTLPVLNKSAVEKAIQVGLIFDCRIADVSKWDRKSYFYPDMPKNYQISQYDQPLCEGGMVEIELPGATRNVMGEHRKVPLTRIHLEEDVGKSIHQGRHSLLDFNRAGAPLLEIVSEPAMHSIEEVFAFLTSLRMHVVYAGLSDADMEKGQLRCDANVSVRPSGSDQLGTKVEIKNLNSISGVCEGVAFEIQRQVREIQKGGRITQETRRWNEERSATVSMRSKEEAHDYRYFPDPDLMPVKISREWRDRLRELLPERPFDRQRRFVEQYGLPYALTSVLCPERELCDFFEEAVAHRELPHPIANFVVNDLLRQVAASADATAVALGRCKMRPAQLAELAGLVADGVISKQIAQDYFAELFQSGESPASLVERKGLKQSSDEGELLAICAEAITANPAPAEQFRAGKENAINALKGQVMKATRGRANPGLVDEILRRLLAG